MRRRAGGKGIKIISPFETCHQPTLTMRIRHIAQPFRNPREITFGQAHTRKRVLRKSWLRMVGGRRDGAGILMPIVKTKCLRGIRSVA